MAILAHSRLEIRTLSIIKLLLWFTGMNILLVLGSVWLFFKVVCQKRIKGVSGKTQFLYVIIYTCQIVDSLIVGNFATMIAVLPIVLILLGTLWILYTLYKSHYEAEEMQHDRFSIAAILIMSIASIPLAFLVTYFSQNSDFFLIYAYCINLFALIPQFYFAKKAKENHLTINVYLLLLAAHNMWSVLGIAFYVGPKGKLLTFSIAFPITATVVAIFSFVFLYPTAFLTDDNVSSDYGWGTGIQLIDEYVAQRRAEENQGDADKPMIEMDDMQSQQNQNNPVEPIVESDNNQPQQDQGNPSESTTESGDNQPQQDQGNPSESTTESGNIQTQQNQGNPSESTTESGNIQPQQNQGNPSEPTTESSDVKTKGYVQLKIWDNN